MSQFQATKCDECGRIQGEANHWTQLEAWVDPNNPVSCFGVTLGEITGNLISAGNFSGSKPRILDFCGQVCAVKHIAKLLKWNLPTEG